jgi:CRP/FNR family transcriptional regulator
MCHKHRFPRPEKKENSIQLNTSEILQQCPLFSSLPEETLRRVSSICDKQAILKGVEIFAQGDICEGFYIVAEGSVKVFRLSPAGREQILAVARTGQSFGEAALFAGKDYPAYAETLEDSLLLFIPRDEFLSLLEQQHEMALQIIAGLSQWLRRMVSLVEDAVLVDVDTRLARFLLDLFREQQSKNQPEATRRLPMKKHVLASHLATTAPTLSRALGRLEEKSIIAMRGNDIELLDMDGLIIQAEGD